MKHCQRKHYHLVFILFIYLFNYLLEDANKAASLFKF